MVRTALANPPEFANKPHALEDELIEGSGEVPPSFPSEEPVKNPAVPDVESVHAPNPVTLSLSLLSQPGDPLYAVAAAVLSFTSCILIVAGVDAFAAQDPLVTDAR
jgi:hypothetical protein